MKKFNWIERGEISEHDVESVMRKIEDSHERVPYTNSLCVISPRQAYDNYEMFCSAETLTLDLPRFEEDSVDIISGNPPWSVDWMFPLKHISEKDVYFIGTEKDYLVMKIKKRWETR